MPKILLYLIDNSESALLEKALKSNGFETSFVRTGEKAFESLLSAQPDIVTIETELPGMNGFEVCRLFKADARTMSLPVILIGTHNSRSEILAGFEAGACEFLVRPLDPRLFVAHVQALFRHVREIRPNLVLKAGIVALDTENHTVVSGNRPVRLARKEFALLELFMRRVGKLLSSQFILGMVWGEDRKGGTHSLAVHIQRLRKKLGDKAGSLIETVHGLGYRMREEE